MSYFIIEYNSHTTLYSGSIFKPLRHFTTFDVARQVRDWYNDRAKARYYWIENTFSTDVWCGPVFWRSFANAGVASRVCYWKNDRELIRVNLPPRANSPEITDAPTPPLEGFAPLCRVRRT